jgi:hypothetical protein
MTYLQAIREDLQPFPVSSNMITRKCQKHGITPSDDVVDETKVLLIEIELLSQIISLQSVSEGGVNKSFDKESAVMLLKRLCSEAGLEASSYVKEPTITFLEDMSC